MGDREFEEFMDDDKATEYEGRPLPFFLVLSLREKMKSITEMYQVSTNVYHHDKTDPQLKEMTKEFISDLMTSCRNTLNQFDILMSSEIYEEDPDEDDGEDFEDGE